MIEKLLQWLWAKRSMIMMNVATAFWILKQIVESIWFPNGTIPDPWDKILLSVAFVLSAIGFGAQTKPGSMVIKKVLRRN